MFGYLRLSAAGSHVVTSVINNARISSRMSIRHAIPAMCPRAITVALSERHRSQSTATSIDLCGIFAAITTPFAKDDPNESIAYDKLQANVSKWNADVPFAGYLVLGSTGEVAGLSHDERVEIVRRMRNYVPRSSNKLLLAGSGCESTIDTINLSVKLSQAGADALVVVTPSYYKGRLGPEALEKHYIRVADASPVPIILYSVPMNTTIDLDPDVVIRLSNHPNIVGVKDSGGDISKITYMAFRTRAAGFQVVAGSAGFLMPALEVGCVGAVLASANVLGSQVCRLYDLVKAGKHAEARELQGRLVLPNWAVTKRFGIAGLKQAMDWSGLYGGPTRSPLLPLTEMEKSSLMEAFKASQFL